MAEAVIRLTKKGLYGSPSRSLQQDIVCEAVLLFDHICQSYDFGALIQLKKLRKTLRSTEGIGKAEWMSHI